ncbi:MAG: prephenate dehydratase [Candidatus Methanoplasma sp.]|jgi:prephenate dehydratase|nr:prephenate dehydratase [Candidatus Methanoplasma sp.]
MKIAYFGPEGTFTEQAARCFAGSMDGEDISFSPLASIEDVFEAVETGAADCGVVPIENSIEGGVNTTIDTLIFDADLFISKQLSLPVVQNMMVSKKNADGRVSKILSHPQALAQCRKFINKHYPDAVTEASNSTAEAARITAGCGLERGGTAAIGSKNSAEIYDLKIIHENIQDDKNNMTQFVLLTKTDTSAPMIGRKTSIAFSTEHRPGELYKILDIFALWDLNMTKIMSRPTKGRQWEYVFFIEIEGYENAADVADALTMIKRKTVFFKNLGSYQTLAPPQ